VLPHAAGDQCAGAPTGAGTARRPVRALWEPYFADHGGKGLRGICGADAGTAEAGARHRGRAREQPARELAIAANEATCIYVLPKVFSEYRQLFPAVQLQVLRSYGARVVEAVMENSADFGLTQLPVEEKRIQVVNIYHDEIRLMVPAGHALADKKSVLPQDLVEHFLILPKQARRGRG